MYGAEEIARIIQLDRPHWDMPLCRLVARYAGRMPREALDFARAMVQEEDLNGGDWDRVAARVARSLKIDRYGLTRRRLNVLVALGQVGAVSKGRMTDYAGCGSEELEKFVMPALLVATTDDPAMVAVTNKGYAITWRGIQELDRRGIPHRGAEAVADGRAATGLRRLGPGRLRDGGRVGSLVPSRPKKRMKTLADYLRQADATPRRRPCRSSSRRPLPCRRWLCRQSRCRQ